MARLEDELQELIELLKRKETVRNSSASTPIRPVSSHSINGDSFSDSLDTLAKKLDNAANSTENFIKSRDSAHGHYINSLITLRGKITELENSLNTVTGTTKELYEKKIEELKYQEQIIVNEKNILSENEEYSLEQERLNAERSNLDRKFNKELQESNKKRLEAENYSYEYSIKQQKQQNELYDIELRFRQDNIKKQQEIWDIEKKNKEKELEINLKHNEAMAKARKEELKGYTNDGKKKSSAEIHQLIGGLKKWNIENSFGRKAGEIASMVTSGIAGTGRTIASGNMDVGAVADKLSGTLSKAGPWGAAAGGLVQVLKTAFELYSKVDKAASDYAKSVGGAKSAQVSMRISAAQLASELSKFGEKAYLAEDILKNMSEVSLSLGRNLEHISHIGLRDLGNLKDFGVDGGTIAQFDTFGVSVENVSKQIAELYGQSGKKGLNAQATIKAFTSNLKMAQNYTFARGQKALADMALKSAQLKFNLKDAEQFANKVSTLEGAMKAGASLSVLGGQFAMQGNPLAMLNEGLNDVESLQERMLAMTKDMAYWNSSKEQLEITAFDRERLKAMSEYTGIDYSELTTQAMNQARVERISRQLGPGIDKDLAEYIKNIAELDEHGNAVVSFMGEDKPYSIDDLKKDPEALEKLKKESESRELKKNATVGDIANDTRSIQDKLDDIVKTIKGKIVNLLMKIAGVTDEEKARMNGLNDRNAEYFEDLSDDYNWWGMSDNGLEHLKKLGIEENVLKQIRARELSQDRFDKVLMDALLAKQTEGYTYKGNINGGIEYAYNKNFDDAFVKTDVAERHASGGYIGIGKSGIDEVPMFGTRGEYVAKKDTMSDPFKARIIEGVDKGWIKPGDNTYGFKNFNQGGVVSNQTTQVGSGNRLGVEKANIDIKFSEPLKIQMGDITKVINENVLASILLQNQNFVQSIITKIGIMDTGFGYHKDNANNPFPSQLYT